MIFTEEALQILSKGYLQQGEAPEGMYLRLAKTAAKYYEGTPLEPYAFAAFETLFTNQWLSPATPVAANFGAKEGLPVSCFSLHVPNSIQGIFDSATEAAMLSKNGGGLGVYLGAIEGITNSAHWALLYDYTARVVSQGGVRRGAVAIYTDIEHPDLPSLLNAKDTLKGDPREKLECNIAVTISDSFMERLLDGGSKEAELYNKVLESRLKQGSPYIAYMGNINANKGEAYEKQGLNIETSNLCSEITLHTSDDYTFNCVLSSFNLRKYEEYKNTTLFGWHPFAWGLFFLDAVQQEFIDKASKLGRSFERSVNGAIKGRPVGLGTLGLHTHLQQKGLVFGTNEAIKEDYDIHRILAKQTRLASEYLASILGEPDWCEGLGIRNTHTIAIAPTTTNSALCNALSPGIEPMASNYYVVSGAKGTFIRKNEVLESELAALGLNTPSIWKAIRVANGSVQQLSIPSNLKQVFKTFAEIEPLAIIAHGASRQMAIDSEGQGQAQSLNLHIASNTPAKEIAKIHVRAWELGIKSLYYVRSDNKLTGKSKQRAHLLTRPDCEYCVKAKQLLTECGIAYTEELKEAGKVPVIMLDGEKIDGGYTGLLAILRPTTSQADEPTCLSCEG